MKQEHSIRVMEISKQIAQGLNLNEEQVKVATLIGLLHDVARFEQFTKYRTFNDNESIDHGDYGVAILEKDIRKYIKTDKYDPIIKKAVKNHNKFKIEEGLTEEEILYSKIIRDADKVDIFYESVEMFWKGKEKQIEESIINNEILEEFKKGMQIDRKKNKVENINEIISVIAFIYDINFKASFEILKKENYINKILNRYNVKDTYTREKIEEIRKIANIYVNEKSKGMN